MLPLVDIALATFEFSIPFDTKAKLSMGFERSLTCLEPFESFLATSSVPERSNSLARSQLVASTILVVDTQAKSLAYYLTHRLK